MMPGELIGRKKDINIQRGKHQSVLFQSRIEPLQSRKGKFDLPFFRLQTDLPCRNSRDINNLKIG